jgi:ketosteroid isomerase-like protein
VRAGAPADPAAAVEAFHAALRAGDSAAAEALLAPDAIVLEQGHSETRGQYLSHHLPADIAFAQSAAQQRGPAATVVSGDVAWVSATTLSALQAEGETKRSQGAELVVLSRGANGWRIRAIHWSSHALREPAR